MFLHWTPQLARNPNWIQKSTVSTVYDMVYANGYYVAVGSSGQTWRSTDRNTWTSYGISGVTDDVKGVTWNGSKFYAVYSKSDGTVQIVESTDGTGWSNTINMGTGSGSAVGIKSDGAGITIAVSSNRDVYVENTVNPWSNAADVYTSGVMNQLEYTSGTWWVTGTRYVYTGNATGTWTRYDVSGGSVVFRDIVEDDSGNLVVVGVHSSGTPGVYLSSNNGTSWSALTAPDGDYNSVEYGDNRLLAVDTTTDTVESTDASTFSTVGHTGATADLYGVRWINGEFIAYGNGIWILNAIG